MRREQDGARERARARRHPTLALAWKGGRPIPTRLPACGLRRWPSAAPTRNVRELHIAECCSADDRHHHRQRRSDGAMERWSDLQWLSCVCGLYCTAPHCTALYGYYCCSRAGARRAAHRAGGPNSIVLRARFVISPSASSAVRRDGRRRESCWTCFYTQP